MEEANKKKGKIRKWVDDHAVEIAVSGFGLLCVAGGYVLGHGAGINSHRAKVCRELPDVIDLCGQAGSYVTFELIEGNVPEAMTLINDFIEKNPDKADVRNRYFKFINANLVDTIDNKLL